MTDAGFQLGEGRHPWREMLRWLIPSGTEASAATLLFSWFSIMKTSTKSNLFFNGVLLAELLVVTLFLGHGWQVCYCNCGLFVRLNVYINLFSFKQEIAELSTIGKAWKSPLSKEVKACLPVFKCFFFCSQDFFPGTLSRLSTFVPLNHSSSVFSLLSLKRRPSPGESTGFRTNSPTKQYSTFYEFNWCVLF